MLRITIYGYIIGQPRHDNTYRAALVDLVYFINDPQFENAPEMEQVRAIHNIVENAGMKIIPKYYRDDFGGKHLEAPRVEIERWDSHLKTGIEDIGEASHMQQPETGYDRFNLPPTGG